MGRKILFLCIGNSSRSQMAEGFARQYFPDDFEAYSAGINPTTVNPYAVLVMQEIGIDISEQYSKSVAELLETEFDVVVTLCDEAHEQCPVFPGKARRFHFSLPDPAVAIGNSEKVLNTFRNVRDQIQRELIPLLERFKGK